MYATSPPESVHALDPAALSGPGISFWTAREHFRAPGLRGAQAAGTGRGRDQVDAHVGAGARAGRSHGPSPPHPGGGPDGGYRRLFLETGSQEFFAPARRLYQRHGFAVCPPFAGYEPDPNSVFMTLSLDTSDAVPHDARPLDARPLDAG